MSDFVITGGRRLSGTAGVFGAKNAVLKEMAAMLLAPGRYRLTNVPKIIDVDLMADVLRHAGAYCAMSDHELTVTIPSEILPEAPIDLVRAMRASIVVLGPMLARCGRALVALPGGDDLGSRPIDMHVGGLEAMGVRFELIHGVLVATTEDGLRGAEVELPFPSVGATENLLLAGVLARGETVIVNAAREPEIEDLVTMLVAMGAKISGAGTAIIHIQGVEELSPVSHDVIPDRLEAGTFGVAAAITGGDVTITGCRPQHLRVEINKLREAGCEVETGEGWLRVRGPDRPRPVDFATLPYPGFHTDMQPQMVALLTVASGTSVITENLYDARFRYIGELARMGADITTEWQHAVIRGVETLSGAPVVAHDIRAGAAMVLAGLRAEGVTTVADGEHIDRGYEDLSARLERLGADIRRT